MIIDKGLQYQMLTEKQSEMIAESAYRILANTGCEIRYEPAKKILAEKGCTVEGDLVKIPVELSKWAVEQAPSELTLYTRDGKPAMELKPGNVYFGPAITVVQLKDYETGELRRATKQDSVNAAIIMDQLENLAWVSPFTSPNDVPAAVSDLSELYAILPNTNKPVMYWAQGVETLKYQFEMFEAIGGSAEAIQEKPFMVNLVCPLDPLVHTEEGMSQLIYLAEKKSPAVYIAGVGFGLSGPATVAGSVALGIADSLAGLVVAQCVNPGTPFVISKFSDNVDYRAMSVTHSNPEMQVALAATADVFRYMKLPFCLNLGGSTDNNRMDPVSTFDSCTKYYTALLSRSNMNFGMGSYQSGSYGMHEDFVFANEMIGFVKALVTGVEVDEESLAEDVIDEVGPGGNFLCEEHTLDHLYDFWQADLMKPVTPRSTDTRTIQEKLTERVKELVANGSKHPLDPERQAKLDEIMERATRELVK